MLTLIQPEYTEEIDMLILRQPKTKEETVSPCWGRLGYWTNIGRYSGVAIFLEAQQIDRPMKWKTSMSPHQARELERLRNDGHDIQVGRRAYVITRTVESVRSTQLFRTLLHEIGHNSDPKPFDRQSQEKEDFAHRFADEMRDKLIADGAIPFPRILDEQSILATQGLRLEWFLADG